VGLGFLEWGPAVTIGLAAALFVPVWLLVTKVRRRQVPPVGSPASRLSQPQASIWTIGGLVAFWAAATVSPPAAMLLLVLATLTSPWLLRRVRTAVLKDLGPGTAGPAVAPLPVDESPEPTASLEVAQLDDRDLCWVWRRSFWDLDSRHTPEETLRLVAFRQECLDELERRDATAFREWLLHGARASGGPERYWHGTPHRGSDAA
jgi:hypothetical protein